MSTKQQQEDLSGEQNPSKRPHIIPENVLNVEKDTSQIVQDDLNQGLSGDERSQTIPGNVLNVEQTTSQTVQDDFVSDAAQDFLNLDHSDDPDNFDSNTAYTARQAARVAAIHGDQSGSSFEDEVQSILSNTSTASDRGPFRIYYRVTQESENDDNNDPSIEMIRRKFVRLFFNIFEEADRISGTLADRFMQTFRDMISEMSIWENRHRPN